MITYFSVKKVSIKYTCEMCCSQTYDVFISYLYRKYDNYVYGNY